MIPEDKLSRQISASGIAQSSSPFSEIQYNSKRLEKIIENLSLSDKHQIAIKDYLNTIHKEAIELKLYSAEEKSLVIFTNKLEVKCSGLYWH